MKLDQFTHFDSYWIEKDSSGVFGRVYKFEKEYSEYFKPYIDQFINTMNILDYSIFLDRNYKIDGNIVIETVFFKYFIIFIPMKSICLFYHRNEYKFLIISILYCQ